MPFLPEVIVSLIAQFSVVFTVPTWKYAQTLLIGSILCKGKRTVTSALRVMGLSKEHRFERYHRVLNKAVWNEFSLVKVLLGMLIQVVPMGNNIYIAFDETIERRSGKRIKAKGCYRDACRSTNSLVIKCFGLKWQCASLIVKLPWSNRYWALPFMTVLCPSKKHDEAKDLVHKTSIDKAIQMVGVISKLLRRSWIFLGDGGFACFKLANKCISSNVKLISRLRLDACLYLDPENPIGKKGRKSIKGKKIEALKSQIATNSIKWQETRIAWYGRVMKTVQLATGVNLWYKSGEVPVKIRWVLVKDLETGRVEALFSTEISHSAQFIVESFVLRWNLEVTFEEVRANLGVETQRQWSDKAIKRTTPILMGTFSLICLMASKLNEQKNDLITAVTTAWYDKQDNATFSDVHAYVKSAIARDLYFNKSEFGDEFIKIPRQEFENIVNNWLMAA